MMSKNGFRMGKAIAESDGERITSITIYGSINAAKRMNRGLRYPVVSEFPQKRIALCPIVQVEHKPVHSKA